MRFLKGPFSKIAFVGGGLLLLLSLVFIKVIPGGTSWLSSLTPPAAIASMAPKTSMAPQAPQVKPTPIEATDQIIYPENEYQQILRFINDDSVSVPDSTSVSVSSSVSTSSSKTVNDPQITDQSPAHALSTLVPPLSNNSIGIIVPHHLMAAQALAQTYHWLSDYNPDVIVLLTPNHQPVITAPLITRTQDVMAGKEIFHMDPLVKDLANQGLVTIDNASFLKEHGFYNHLPFIRANGWQAPIVPVAMARNAGLDSLVALRTAINSRYADQKVLWIASIDFSHYLPAAVAESKDQETQQWIESRDYSSVLGSTSDHLDAPAVLVMWLMQFESTHFIWKSNSAQITGGGHQIPGTSYLIYYGY